MIDTLRNKIDVVRSLGERVSLLRLRNRSYILVENRRDRVSERTDRLIPLPPCFGWQECLAAFHAQALQWRKQPEQIHYLRGDGIEHVRFLHGDYHVFMNQPDLGYFLVRIIDNESAIPSYGIIDLSADLEPLKLIRRIETLCQKTEICLAVSGSACLFRNPASDRYFAVRFGNKCELFGKCIKEIVLLPEESNVVFHAFEQQACDWERRFGTPNIVCDILF